ncbi:hypothetical protein BH10ACI3_BH10ACI3_14990 [soil metagenome]
MVIGLSFAVSAQRDDTKKPPPKGDPPVVTPQPKNPQPRETPKPEKPHRSDHSLWLPKTVSENVSV